MFTGQPAFDGEREDRLLVCYCPREIFVKGWMPLGHAIRVHIFIFCQIIFRHNNNYISGVTKPLAGFCVMFYS